MENSEVDTKEDSETVYILDHTMAECQTLFSVIHLNT